MAPAYRWHHSYLQRAAARHPARPLGAEVGRAPLGLPELLAEYPDARFVQTHRDPVKIIASLSSLFAYLGGISSDDVTLPEVAAPSGPTYILDGLDRSVTAREDGSIPPDRVVDVQFDDVHGRPVRHDPRDLRRLGRRAHARRERPHARVPRRAQPARSTASTATRSPTPASTRARSASERSATPTTSTCRPNESSSRVRIVVSIDIDGTMEFGEPPGPVTVALVQTLVAAGHVVGCARPTARAPTSRTTWAGARHRAHVRRWQASPRTVRERFACRALRTRRRHACRRALRGVAGFEFVTVDDPGAALAVLQSLAP